MTVAVAIEDSLGHCIHGKKNHLWFTFPSILESRICVNSQTDPARKLVKVESKPHNLIQNDLEDKQKWSHVWDVQNLAEGDTLKVKRPLRRWNLSLDVSPESSFRRLFAHLKASGSESLGHWEYTEREGETFDVMPIPVRISKAHRLN